MVKSANKPEGVGEMTKNPLFATAYVKDTTSRVHGIVMNTRKREDGPRSPL